VRLAPPLLNPTKGGFEKSDECASYRDRHAGLQSTETRPSRGSSSADTIEKQLLGCPNAIDGPRSAASCVPGGVASHDESDEGRAPSHKALTYRIAGMLSGGNWEEYGLLSGGKRGQRRRFQQNAEGVGDTYGR
jgi:hypothetical protein